jgi:pimeloyl-ACP methyl ester carboxylesterase
VGAAKVCYRYTGQGPALIFLHGYPLSGRTWRKVIAGLSQRFTCYAFDMIGLGDSRSPRTLDHSSQGQAAVLQHALATIGLSSYSLLANNSGGWIARELALLQTERVEHLILTNTEIPGHRPPWISPYQILARLPGAGFLFRMMISSRSWRESTLGFGGCFDDPSFIEGEFAKEFLLPLLLSHDRMCSALRFLIHMKFRRVDQFRKLHQRLSMPVAFIWGAADPTFPENLAREMALQFPNVLGFKSIPRGKLFMQEEMPDELISSVNEFLS